MFQRSWCTKRLINAARCDDQFVIIDSETTSIFVAEIVSCDVGNCRSTMYQSFVKVNVFYIGFMVAEFWHPVSSSHWFFCETEIEMRSCCASEEGSVLDGSNGCDDCYIVFGCEEAVSDCETSPAVAYDHDRLLGSHDRLLLLLI